jgi:hypothetical protein
MTTPTSDDPAPDEPRQQAEQAAGTPDEPRPTAEQAAGAPDEPRPTAEQAAGAPEPEPTAQQPAPSAAGPAAEPAAPEVSAGPPAAGAAAGDVAPAHQRRRVSTGPLRLLAILALLGGVILIVAGVITWFVVRDQLSDEQIVVSEDADNFAGEPVEGPFTAYAEAEVINDHALEASDGQTYAQLDQDDPTRETVMTASFLRASLFTSVVAFGVAAFAGGMGLLMIIVGLALLAVDRALKR